MLRDKNFWWGAVAGAIVAPWVFNRWIRPSIARRNGMNGR